MNVDIFEKIISPIILTVLGGTTLSSLIIFFVQRHDNNKKEEEAKKSTDKYIRNVALSAKRCELFILMYHRPEDRIAILMAAHEYFVDMKGNSYMGPIFYKWLKENSIPIPPWFNDIN